ncbi:MAG: LCP family protein [Cyanosarcina radialis HA8281-LM2]|jgi:LCP family protein required for cell wall assembly|nr:LCP family protein [Cyanosarcina radialis HA8281-LM2]
MNELRFLLAAGKSLLWAAAFVAIASVSATLGVAVALLTPMPQVADERGKTENENQDLLQYRLAHPVNILVMGIDRVPDAAENSPEIFNGNSDTMLLLRLDPKNRSVKMLSIPRDTRVVFPKLTLAKINQANVEGGPVLAARVVSHILNRVSVDRYVRVSTGAFRELVNQVGGIDVFVPQRMKYVDNTQKLNIDLQPGWQTLNGDQAEQFARFRRDENGDIGRVQRQQILLKALREKLQTPAVLPQVPQLVRVMQQYVDTNLSLPETLAVVSFGLNLEPKDFQMVMLPGRFSSPDEYKASYWIMNRRARDRIAQEYFQQKPLRASSLIQPSRSELQIALQNASGEPQLPELVNRDLRKKGFENVYIVKDWPEKRQQTEIIVEQGDSKAAIALSQSLGLGKVESASTGDIGSDLTIRLGTDGIAKYKVPAPPVKTKQPQVQKVKSKRIYNLDRSKKRVVKAQKNRKRASSLPQSRAEVLRRQKDKQVRRKI